MASLEDKLRDQEGILRALRLSARDAAILHKSKGVPMAIWRDGQVVQIPPDEIEIPEVP